MNRNATRTTAFLLTAALAVTSLCGCAKNGNGGGISNIGGNKANKGKLEVSFDHSYSGEKIDLGEIKNPQSGELIGDKVLITGYDENYNNQLAVLYNPADGSSKKIEFAYPKTLGEDENSYIQSSFLDSEGNYEVLFSGYGWKKGESEDGEDDEYYDLGSTIEVYDKDFNVIETRSLKDVFGEDVGVSTVVASPAGGYLVSMWDNNTGSQIVSIYDKDFKKTGDLKANLDYIENMYTARDGNVYISYETDDNQPGFGTIDLTTCTINPVEIKDKPTWVRGCFASQDDKYDLCMYDTENVYGVNVKAGTCEPILNWLNSDFIGNYIGAVLQLGDGRFMVTSNTMNNKGQEYSQDTWLLTARPADAFKDVKMISMAGLYIADDVMQQVLSFNRTHDDVRIGVVSYEKYSTEDNPEGSFERFKTDMTSGIVADLILTQGLPYESFANKGLFLDLTDRMSAYTDADYFMNVFDALKYGDKLYHVGASYSVETIEGKEELVGSKMGLSAAEFMQLVKNLPAGTAAFGEMTKESAGYSLLSTNVRNFVDAGAGTCSFDSPEFIEMLEFCNTFPTQEEMDKTMEENQKYWDEQQYQYINGKTAMATTWIYSLRDAYRQRMTNFDKAKVTRVGYPVAGSSGNGGRFSVTSTIAISANTDLQEECWTFVSSMFSEEAQESLQWVLPVSRKAFDKQVEEAMKPETYKDEEGKEVTAPFTIWRGDEEIKMPEMPKSFADDLKSYIEGIRDVDYYDNTLQQIVDEEAQKFYAGDQTAQQAASMIQNRASLYLSEQA